MLQCRNIPRLVSSNLPLMFSDGHHALVPGLLVVVPGLLELVPGLLVLVLDLLAVGLRLLDNQFHLPVHSLQEDRETSRLRDRKSFITTCSTNEIKTDTKSTLPIARFTCLGLSFKIVFCCANVINFSKIKQT